MAQENVSFKVNIRKNQNAYSHAYRHYYAEPDENKALNLKGFARHLAEHGKLATYEMLVLVLQNIVDCMTELLSKGIPVKLDGLGTFRPTITNIRMGAESLEKLREMGIDNLIEGVNMAFYPENSKGEELTTKEFKKKCVFELAYVIARKSKVIDGTTKYYQEKIPWSSFETATAEADGQSDPDTP